MITDGDVAGAISTAWPDSGVDVLFGIGGTPEGVISAAALKCMRGEIQGLLWPRERRGAPTAAIAAGYNLDEVLTTDDLVPGDNCFFAATGITDGEMLQGVQLPRLRRHHPVARHAVSMSGTVRFIGCRHPLHRLRRVQLDRLRLSPTQADPVQPRVRRSTTGRGDRRLSQGATGWPGVGWRGRRRSRPTR